MTGQSHGLARVREEEPATYLRVAFNNIPKDVQIAIEQRTRARDADDAVPVESIEACAPAQAEQDRIYWTDRGEP
jgi:hypothetical protein